MTTILTLPIELPDDGVDEDVGGSHMASPDWHCCSPPLYPFTLGLHRSSLHVHIACTTTTTDRTTESPTGRRGVGTHRLTSLGHQLGGHTAWTEVSTPQSLAKHRFSTPSPLLGRNEWRLPVLLLLTQKLMPAATTKTMTTGLNLTILTLTDDGVFLDTVIDDDGCQRSYQDNKL
ncbi:hypothetical protein BaRGS_00029834 [Batillaria attramentaria]|uniref:Uncharacterized protein n=1 Tax=Batillaria attramentaria TaxID=370345 RepID=A0ABD0JWE2_9CAEN